MFQKILFASDGSENANNAADATLSLAQNLPDVEVILFHASADPPTRSELVQAGMDVSFLLRTKAKELLQSTEARFKEAGISYTLQTGLGEPAQVIVDATKEHKIDLVIIGSRGLGSVNSLLLGSVSRRVAQDAPCPVMIVK